MLVTYFNTPGAFRRLQRYCFPWFQIIKRKVLSFKDFSHCLYIIHTDNNLSSIVIRRIVRNSNRKARYTPKYTGGITACLEMLI